MARRKSQAAGKAAEPVTVSKATAKKEVVNVTKPVEESAKAEALSVKAAVEPVVEEVEVKKPSEDKKTEEKPAVKKTEKTAAKKTGLEKKTSEVSADVPKDTAVKTAVKKSVKKQEMQVGISVQYMGKDISDKDMINRVKNDWTASKHKIGDIKTLELYVKVEENRVYYVINGTETGSVEI